jgi:hypothetical protein
MSTINAGWWDCKKSSCATFGKCAIVLIHLPPPGLDLGQKSGEARIERTLRAGPTLGISETHEPFVFDAEDSSDPDDIFRTG